MNRDVRNSLILSTAIAACFGTSAWGQATTGMSGSAAAQAGQAVPEKTAADATQTADRPVTNDDVVVTARRTNELLQDVPISITVFNQQQLTNRNVVNSSDLANYTPSLSANPNFGSENTSFAIRGFSQDPGTQPSVAYISRTSSHPVDRRRGRRPAMVPVRAISSISRTFRC